jgi:hypothetical protein
MMCVKREGVRRKVPPSTDVRVGLNIESHWKPYGDWRGLFVWMYIILPERLWSAQRPTGYGGVQVCITDGKEILLTTVPVA